MLNVILDVAVAAYQHSERWIDAYIIELLKNKIKSM